MVYYATVAHAVQSTKSPQLSLVRVHLRSIPTRLQCYTPVAPRGDTPGRTWVRCSVAARRRPPTRYGYPPRSDETKRMMQPLLPVNRSLSAALDALLGQVRALIQAARQQALRAVDTVQVRTYWEIGRYIADGARIDLT